MIPRDVLDALQAQLRPRACNSAAFIYDHMESQSGGALPLVYVPFDGREAAHFCDRGQILDFAASIGSGRVLDFGPGDGWPALPLAQYAEHVTGVDASARRVATCRENAQRLGIGNAEFVHVAAGAPLPFANGSFDGATAASSVEQTPDPAFALRELARVLRPGGRLRMTYESLAAYRGGMEQAVALLDAGGGCSILLVYDRRVDDETAYQYRLSTALSLEQLHARFAEQGIRLESPWRPGPPPARGPQFTHELLNALAPYVTDAAVCRTSHPTGRTFVRLLHEAGFADVRATQSGGDCAGRLLAELQPEQRPRSMAEVDALLAEPVRAAVNIAAAIEDDPPLIAIKA